MPRRIRVSTCTRVSPEILDDRVPRVRGRWVERSARSLPSTTFPGPSDYQANAHPTGRAWVRSIGGRNMWLWYRFNDDEVILVKVTTDPPLPLDE